jgi:hypothetical protein
MVPLDLGVPASRSSDSVRRDGRAVAGTTEIPSNVGCSLLCFEEAVISATSPRQNGRPARGRAPHSVRSSLRRHVPPPRTLHGFGAILENCIASTSVLKEVAPCSFSSRGRVEECAISSYKEPTVDALAPGADEGRGWLRKATGSCLPSFDPWISEWGNPAGVMPSHSCLNT